jgi:hypothetical protein
MLAVNLGERSFYSPTCKALFLGLQEFSFCSADILVGRCRGFSTRVWMSDFGD